MLNVQLPQEAGLQEAGPQAHHQSPPPAPRPWVWPRGPGSMSPTTRDRCRAGSSSACKHGRASAPVSPVHCEQKGKTQLSAPRGS